MLVIDCGRMAGLAILYRGRGLAGGLFTCAIIMAVYRDDRTDGGRGARAYIIIWRAYNRGKTGAGRGFFRLFAF